MPARRNPADHPGSMSAAQACRRQHAERSCGRGAPVSDDAFKRDVDRGYRRFWRRRGVDVDSFHTQEF